VQNLAPTLIGTMTIFGVVVQNETVFLWTFVIIAITCVISTAQMVRHEIQRCLRLKLIDQRRKRRDANPTGC